MDHIAIIADGNRRWAVKNGLPPVAGYPQGLMTIETCCAWAISRGIRYITIYVFSTENWKRPPAEVENLMDLARWHFAEKRDWYIHAGIRVRFAGRRDRLPADITESCAALERDTVHGQALTLTICADYGGRDEIVRAIAAGAKTEEEITSMLTASIPEPDAIFRTGGCRRLSNFMLWQAAYTELFFTDACFPDVSEAELDAVLDEFRARGRNWGS